MSAQGIGTAGEGRSLSGVSAWAARHPLVTFYVMAFGFAWLVWIPFLTLSRSGIGLLPFTAPVLPLTIFGSFAGPTLAAFIMTSVLQGRPGVMNLLRRYVRFRAPAVWYLFAVFFAPLGQLAATSILLGAGPIKAFASGWPMLFTFYLPVLVLTVLVGGGLAEEPGWRGFALPRLESRYGPLVGTLVSGLLWGLWHMPLLLVSGSSQAGFNPIVYLGATLGWSVVITWVYNCTNGRLPLVMLLHASNNAASALYLHTIPGTPNHDWALLVLWGLAGAAVIMATRGQLGYRTVSAGSMPEGDEPTSLFAA